jgi:hypothetical protein
MVMIPVNYCDIYWLQVAVYSITSAGFFSAIPIAWEFCAELTFPIPVALSGGTMFMVVHVTGGVLV